jgi:hypothetical protein
MTIFFTTLRLSESEVLWIERRAAGIVQQRLPA